MVLNMQTTSGLQILIKGVHGHVRGHVIIKIPCMYTRR